MNTSPFLGRLRWRAMPAVIALLFGCSREPAERAATKTTSTSKSLLILPTVLEVSNT